MITHISIQHSYMTKTLERLCTLPLFMGISRKDMEEIVEKVKFHFLTISQNKNICNVHQTNDKLYFLLDGDIEVCRNSYSNTIQFIETLPSPALIGADVLFGLTHAFPCSYKAKSTCQLLIIEKKEITEKLLNYEIFRLNYLNLLSMLEQKRLQYLYEPLQEDLEARFITYLKHNLTTLTGKKLLRCKQRDLGTDLLSNERSICKMLNTLEEQGKLQVGRTQITIPAIQNLLK